MADDKIAHNDMATYERAGTIGTITLRRAEKRNALSLALWEAIGRAVEAAEQDTDARVIILQGDGASFCAGLDLSPDNEVFALISETPGALQKVKFFRLVRRLQEIHNRLERLPQPTIAAIHGHCLGAGLELVLCCDIRICTQDTVFGLPEAALAIITDVGGLQRLPRVVGPSHAREIAFTGRRFDAEYARSVNLVNHVYEDKESLDRNARLLADEIASNPPLAVQGAKEVMLRNDDTPLHASLEYTAARSSMVMPSEDMFEAMAAFMQKRKGEFKGS